MRYMYLCKNLEVKEGRGLIFKGGLFSREYGITHIMRMSGPSLLVESTDSIIAN